MKPFEISSAFYRPSATYASSILGSNSVAFASAHLMSAASFRLYKMPINCASLPSARDSSKWAAALPGLNLMA